MRRSLPRLMWFLSLYVNLAVSVLSGDRARVTQLIGVRIRIIITWLLSKNHNVHCTVRQVSPQRFMWDFVLKSLHQHLGVCTVTVPFSNNNIKGHMACGLGWEKGVSQPGPLPVLSSCDSGNICILGSSLLAQRGASRSTQVLYWFQLLVKRSFESPEWKGCHWPPAGLHSKSEWGSVSREEFASHFRFSLAPLIAIIIFFPKLLLKVSS